eukprot:scaffold268_cov134-Isochrysis_galbana.AAC.16
MSAVARLLVWGRGGGDDRRLGLGAGGGRAPGAQRRSSTAVALHMYIYVIVRHAVASPRHIGYQHHGQRGDNAD